MEEVRWIVTCLIMLLPVVYQAWTNREPKGDKRERTKPATPENPGHKGGRFEPVPPMSLPQIHSPAALSAGWRLRLHAPVDRPLIERTLLLISDIERFVQPVTGGKVLLTATSMAQIQAAELPALIAAKEHALVERALLTEQVNVAAFLENLLAVPFPPARHETLEELGLVALRQAYAAREVSEAIHRLRRAIGPLD